MMLKLIKLQLISFRRLKVIIFLIGLILMGNHIYAQPVVDLRINKFATAKADPGDIIAYNIDYANVGGLNAVNVVITDTLPPHYYYTYVSSVPAGVYDSTNRTITWTSSEIPLLTLLGGGSNPPIIVKVKAGVPGHHYYYDSSGYYMPDSDTFDVRNSVSIKADNFITPTTDADTTEVIQYCGVELILPDSGEVKSSSGSQITFLGTIINTGNINNFYYLAVQNLGTTPPGGNPQYTYEILNTSFQPIDSTDWLKPTEVFYFYFRLTVVQSPANRYNTALFIVTDSVCGGSYSDSAHIVTKVHNPGHVPIINFYKSDFPDPVRSGDTLSYTLSVSNSASSYAATGVNIYEIYDPRVTFDTAIPHYPTSGDTAWNIGTIPAGGVWSTLIKVIVDNDLPNGTILTNTAKFMSVEVPLKIATATTTVVSAPDVKITKEAIYDDPLLPGDTITYKIIYENIGNYTATFDTIRDDYDETYIDYFVDAASGDTISSPGKIIWSVGSLSPGAKDSIIYSVKIKDESAFPSVAGSTIITNTAIITLNEIDDNYTNNSAQAYAIVSLLSNLKITKTASPSPAETDQNLTYTLTISNIGNYHAVNDSIIVRDSLPSNVTISSISHSGTETSPGSGVIEWPYVSTLNKGQSFTRWVTVIPGCPTSTTDTLENKAIVFGKLSDADNSDNVYTLKTALIDNSPPILTGTIPSGQTGINDCFANIPAGPTESDIASQYTDNCSSVIVTKSGTPNGDDCSWSVTYSYEVKDIYDNTVTPSPTVTYSGADNDAPTLTGTIPSGQTGINDCFANIPTGPTEDDIKAQYTDDCNNVTVTKSGTPTGDDCAWSVTYSYEVKDDCDNTVTPAPTVTYSGGDNDAPTLTGTIPSGQTGINDCFTNIPAGPTENDIKAQYTDDCNNVTVTKSGTPTGDDCAWSVTYSYEVKDDCDNIVTPAPTVTYSGADNDAPSLTGTIPSGQTGINDCFVNIPAGPTENDIKAQYTDDCNNVTVTKSGTPTGDDCAWSVTYSYEVKDDCDNIVTPAPTVTYSGGDNDAPTL
ncbi:MAG: DUF11 domain-containing protein, partial [Bacteroidales bacterium]|nr:DUF11 domain-containing protein [Bacteroidales bacterium]